MSGMFYYVLTHCDFPPVKGPATSTRSDSHPTSPYRLRAHDFHAKRVSSHLAKLLHVKVAWKVVSVLAGRGGGNELGDSRALLNRGQVG